MNIISSCFWASNDSSPFFIPPATRCPRLLIIRQDLILGSRIVIFWHIFSSSSTLTICLIKQAIYLLRSVVIVSRGITISKRHYRLLQTSVLVLDRYYPSNGKQTTGIDLNRSYARICFKFKENLNGVNSD